MSATVPIAIVRGQASRSAAPEPFRAVRICLCCGEPIQRRPGCGPNPNICDKCNEGSVEDLPRESETESDDSIGEVNPRLNLWQLFSHERLSVAGGGL